MEKKLEMSLIDYLSGVWSGIFLMVLWINLEDMYGFIAGLGIILFVIWFCIKYPNN